MSKSGPVKGSKAATPFLNNALGMVATRFERINDCWLVGFQHTPCLPPLFKVGWSHETDASACFEQMVIEAQPGGGICQVAVALHSAEPTEDSEP